MIRKFKGVVKDLNVSKSQMLKNLGLSRSTVFSQGLLLKLMEKGLVRSQAYDLVQKTAFKALKAKSDLKTQTLKDEKILKHLSAKEIKNIFLPQTYLKNINAIYKRVGVR
jgi:adenylosuccinate lyase